MPLAAGWHPARALAHAPPTVGVGGPPFTDDAAACGEDACRYDANLEKMSWAGLQQLPRLCLSMMLAGGALRDNKEARMVLGDAKTDANYTVRALQAAHGVRLCTAEKLEDPLATRLHHTLRESLPGTETRMVYRLHACLEEASIAESAVVSWHESMQCAVVQGTRIVSAAGLVVGTFSIEYGSLVMHGLLQGVAYDDEFLPLYRTDWTCCTAPTARPETCRICHVGGQDEVSAECISEPASAGEDEAGTWMQSVPGDGAQAPQPGGVQVDENEQIGSKGARGSPALPRGDPIYEMFQVGCQVRFTRRVCKRYGSLLRKQKGIVCNIIQHNLHTYYVVIPMQINLHKYVAQMNRNCPWQVVKLVELGLGLEHVVCPKSSLMPLLE